MLLEWFRKRLNRALDRLIVPMSPEDFWSELGLVMPRLSKLRIELEGIDRPLRIVGQSEDMDDFRVRKLYQAVARWTDSDLEELRRIERICPEMAPGEDERYSMVQGLLGLVVGHIARATNTHVSSRMLSDPERILRPLVREIEVLEDIAGSSREASLDDGYPPAV